MIETGSAAPTRVRPATVAVAFWLQVVIVAVGLVVLTLNVVRAIWYDTVIDRAARLTNPDSADVSAERAFNVEDAAITSAPVLLLVVWLAATLVPVWRGSNVGRILTCVGVGLPVVCCVGVGGGFSLLALPFFFLAASDPEFAEEDDPWAEEGGPWVDDTPFYDKLYELESQSVMSALTAVVPLGFALLFAIALAIGVLLLVPPSNRYFNPGSGRPAPSLYAAGPYPAYPIYPTHHWPPPPPTPPPPPPPRQDDP
ncbi:hypothetical protein WEI85_04215 [Actinomycetes bacterium KLBMP 9797]